MCIKWLCVAGVLLCCGCGQGFEGTVEADCEASVWSAKQGWTFETIECEPSYCPIGPSRPVCVPSSAELDDDGLARCRVTEMLPDSALRCSDFADSGREPIPVAIVDGRDVCAVYQSLSLNGEEPDEPGFYYVEGPSPTNPGLYTRYEVPALLAFTGNALPVEGSEIDYECFTSATAGCY